jgi:hypothetical protein
MSTIKKISVIAVMSLALALTVTTVVGASTVAINTNLTIGSTGESVVALQTALLSQGYLTMPAGVSMGYFGGLTKSAVAKWQAANGVSPAVGYFGSISRGVWNSTVTASTVPGCAAGAAFSATTGAPCTSSVTTVPGCAAGALFSATTGASCTTGVTTPSGTFTMDGSDGSITVSYVSYAPASQTLKKGDMNKPLISVKLQAVNGSVDVTRFDVHFSERPWLDFGQVTLTDSSGNVLATKVLSSAADVTEITVGSDYLVRFDGVNIPVTPGSDKIVAVSANVLAASDKIVGQTVYVGIPIGSIRTVNGKGYTDSLGLSSTQGSAANSTYGNAVILSSTGSTATLYTRISPNTPAQGYQVTSASSPTNDVVLGVFSLKSANQASIVNTLSFYATTSNGTGASTAFSNLRLQAGGNTYGSNAICSGTAVTTACPASGAANSATFVAGTSGTTTTFTNMNLALPQDTWVDVTLLGNINTNQTGYSASTTLIGFGTVGVDSNYNTITLTSASNVTANDLAFSTSVLNLMSGPVATLGSAISGVVPGGISGTVGYNTHYVFTLKNNGNADVYVSRSAGSLVATTSILAGVTLANNASSSITSLTVGDTQPGDNVSALAYVIPSGLSRTFTLDGVMKGGAGGGISRQTITGIYFNPTAASVSATSSASTITSGLNALTLSAGF